MTAMFLDPQRLIDRSIADLTQPSAVFAAELRNDPPPHSPELKVCEEAVATISRLGPRLQVVREARISPSHIGACPNCDE